MERVRVAPTHRRRERALNEKNPFNLRERVSGDGNRRKKKKDPRTAIHLRHFRFPQKLRVTKEDGWQTEILHLFIHRTGGSKWLQKVSVGPKYIY